MFMGFSKQEYWGELTYPSVVDLPDPQYKPASLKSPALVGRFFTISATWEALRHLRSPSRWCVCMCVPVHVNTQSLGHVQLFGTPWAIVRLVPQFRGFSRQKYWSELLFPSPRDFPDPGIKPASLALAGKLFTIASSEMGFSQWLSGKQSACNARTAGDKGFIPGLRRFPWRRKWQLIPVFLPGKFHGQRNLAGYSP